MNSFKNNKQIWGKNNIVDPFDNKKGWLGQLLPPEKVILNIIKEKKLSAMLDIGVGAGRTSSYFSSNFNQYHGIDYSSAMIDSCRKKFSKNKNLKFQVLDARDMSIYSDNSFDFILFSYNGIDYVNDRDRNKILCEIYRICKPGGYFSFSTHNIFSIKKYYKIKMSFHPMRLLRNIKYYLKFVKMNPGLKSNINNPFVYVNDPGGSWNLLTYYINPMVQVEKLKIIGFKKIKKFNLINGLECELDEITNNEKNKWIYFLAKK